MDRQRENQMEKRIRNRTSRTVVKRHGRQTGRSKTFELQLKEAKIKLKVEHMNVEAPTSGIVKWKWKHRSLVTQGYNHEIQ